MDNQKIDSIIEWLTEEDGNHAVGESNIKHAVSELKELKQSLNIHDVSQERELLLAYENYTSKMITGKTNDRNAKSLVNDFLAKNFS